MGFLISIGSILAGALLILSAVDTIRWKQDHLAALVWILCALAAILAGMRG